MDMIIGVITPPLLAITHAPIVTLWLLSYAPIEKNLKALFYFSAMIPHKPRETS